MLPLIGRKAIIYLLSPLEIHPVLEPQLARPVKEPLVGPGVALCIGNPVRHKLIRNIAAYESQCPLAVLGADADTHIYLGKAVLNDVWIPVVIGKIIVREKQVKASEKFNR